VPYSGAFFPSVKLLEASSIFGSAAVSCATEAATEGCTLDAEVEGASGLAFDFDVRDFSLGPWPPALTLMFRHLSYSCRKIKLRAHTNQAQY
jgi:hypothetical protein